MKKPIFSITCTTCQAKLAVRSEAAIGAILECPKCQSMVQVVPPEGWTPAAPSAAMPLADVHAGPPPLDRVADETLALELDPAHDSSRGGLLKSKWFLGGMALLGLLVIGCLCLLLWPQAKSETEADESGAKATDAAQDKESEKKPESTASDAEKKKESEKQPEPPANGAEKKTELEKPAVPEDKKVDEPVKPPEPIRPGSSTRVARGKEGGAGKGSSGSREKRRRGGGKRSAGGE